MAYTTEGNAGYRITGVTALGATIKGNLRATIEKSIVRERIEADANNVPISRPVDEIDARATLDFLDNNSGVDHTTAAGNIVLAFSEANGSGTGGVTIGSMVAGTITHNMNRRMGGFGIQQTFELQGQLTYTPTC